MVVTSAEIALRKKVQVTGTETSQNLIKTAQAAQNEGQREDLGRSIASRAFLLRTTAPLADKVESAEEKNRIVAKCRKVIELGRVEDLVTDARLLATYKTALGAFEKTFPER